MLSRQWAQLLVGLFILFGLLALFFLAFKVSGLTQMVDKKEAYTVVADFDNIGGLKVRAPVAMSGVVVGNVVDIQLDPVSFRARVRLRLDKRYPFPKDTSASIYTQGLLGANYIHLSPGLSSDLLSAGDTIENTQSAIVLERLIGQLMFSLTQGNHKGAAS